MHVRLKTTSQRAVAHKIATEIMNAIKAMHCDGESKEASITINGCANVAYQWAWQNSDRFPKDMKMAEAVAAVIEERQKEARA